MASTTMNPALIKTKLAINARQNELGMARAAFNAERAVLLEQLTYLRKRVEELENELRKLTGKGKPLCELRKTHHA